MTKVYSTSYKLLQQTLLFVPYVQTLKSLTYLHMKSYKKTQNTEGKCITDKKRAHLRRLIISGSITEIIMMPSLLYEFKLKACTKKPTSELCGTEFLKDLSITVPLVPSDEAAKHA